MTTLREAAQQATHSLGCYRWHHDCAVAEVERLRAVLAQRKPLTEKEIKRIDDSTHFHESPDWSLRFARAIEQAHGIE